MKKKMFKISGKGFYGNFIKINAAHERALLRICGKVALKTIWNKYSSAKSSLHKRELF